MDYGNNIALATKPASIVMSKIHSLDLTNRRFGRWLVLSRGHVNVRGEVHWLSRCDCGVEREIKAGSLRTGKSVSCGCYHKERITVHGMTKTRTWKTWDSMLQRCENPNAPDYDRYGARGIKVCAEWHEFLKFLADMGERPEGKTLDRIDVNGMYEPSNCQWATATQQQRNRTDAITATIDGVTKSVWDWADETGVPSGVIKWRLSKGWSHSDAVHKPVRIKTKHEGLN